MRYLAQSSLALIGLALAAPSGAIAQNAPPGFRAAAVEPSGSAPAGLDGQAMPSSAPGSAALPVVMGNNGQPVAVTPPSASNSGHKHKGRTFCARCAKVEDAKIKGMPPVQLVGCAHSSNGACSACRAAWALPGPVTVMSAPPAPAAAEPGRAVASAPAPSGNRIARRGSPASAPAGPSMDDQEGPAPIGVIQANYAQGGPAGMPSGMQGAYSGPSSMPGRAVAESGAGRTPYAPKSGPNPHPHIISHLFGFSGLFGGDNDNSRARRKAEAHAMIPYNNEGTPVNDLPAAMVYGRR